MSNISSMRVKPSIRASGSRIRLMHTLDQMLPVDIFTNLNMFFLPCQSSPAELKDIACSLVCALDIFPVIAGSISEPEGTRGQKIKYLVDDGSGTDIIWQESSAAYADLVGGDSIDLVARTIWDNSDPNATLLMIKFTKFTCGTLCMAISISHTLADCTSTISFLQEWANISRGSGVSENYSINSWERHPQKFFPLNLQKFEVPAGMDQSDVGTPYSDTLSEKTQLEVVFTFEGLGLLKQAASNIDPSLWVSTADGISALLWRSLSRVRRDLIGCNKSVHLGTAVDARHHSRDPNAKAYFGNLVFLVTTTLPQSDLFDSPLSSVASAIRQSLDTQLTETSIANMITFLESVDTIPFSPDYRRGDSCLSSWLKYPLIGDEMDFGWGGPFRVTNGVELMPPGQMYLLPCGDKGCKAIISVESQFASRLREDEELLRFASFSG